jgi:hypothetical protein
MGPSLREGLLALIHNSGSVFGDGEVGLTPMFTLSEAEFDAGISG